MKTKKDLIEFFNKNAGLPVSTIWKDANGQILQFFASFKGEAMKEFEQLKKAGKDVHLFEYTIDTQTGAVFAFEIVYNWGE